MDGNHDRRRQPAAQGNDDHDPRAGARQGEGNEGNRTRGQRDASRERGQDRGQGNGGQGNGGQARNITDVALRGTALMFDLQLETARSLWQTQARAAAMFGMPDFSDLFRVDDERARRVFSDGTEQIVSTLRQATETVAAVQREVGRLAEQQTIGIADQMREQMAELGRQTERGLREIQRMTTQQVDELGESAERFRQAGSQRDAEWQGERGIEPGGRLPAEASQRGDQAAGTDREASGHAGEGRHESRGADDGHNQRPAAGNDERHGRDKARAKA